MKKREEERTKLEEKKTKLVADAKVKEATSKSPNRIVELVLRDAGDESFDVNVRLIGYRVKEAFPSTQIVHITGDVASVEFPVNPGTDAQKLGENLVEALGTTKDLLEYDWVPSDLPSIWKNPRKILKTPYLEKERGDCPRVVLVTEGEDDILSEVRADLATQSVSAVVEEGNALKIATSIDKEKEGKKFGKALAFHIEKGTVSEFLDTKWGRYVLKTYDEIAANLVRGKRGAYGPSKDRSDRSPLAALIKVGGWILCTAISTVAVMFLTVAILMVFK